MKEAEVDALAMPLANARVVHLLLVHRMVLVEVGDGQKAEVGTGGYDQLMYTPECRDHRALLIPCSAGEGRKGPHRSTY